MLNWTLCVSYITTSSFQQMLLEHGRDIIFTTYLTKNILILYWLDLGLGFNNQHLGPHVQTCVHTKKLRTPLLTQTFVWTKDWRDVKQCGPPRKPNSDVRWECVWKPAYTPIYSSGFFVHTHLFWFSHTQRFRKIHASLRLRLHENATRFFLCRLKRIL